MHTLQISGLPATFGSMRNEACVEGYRFMERLALDWASGAMRFDRAGELLLAAYVGGVLAGIGGITLDPVTPDALRMRRFYIRPAFRRQSIGRRLAAALLQQSVLTGGAVTVNAGTADAPAFWEALGFIPDPQEGHTHKLNPNQFRDREHDPNVI